MNEKKLKWILITLCVVSQVFGILQVYVGISGISSESDNYPIDIAAMLFYVFIYAIKGMLILLLAIFLSIAIYKETFDDLHTIYLGLVVTGIICAMPWLIINYKAGVITLLLEVMQGVINSIVALLLYLSIKKCKGGWIVAITVLLCFRLVLMVTPFAIQNDLFLFFPVLIVGLIVNIRNTKKAKYDETTIELENIQKQVSTGLISEEAYRIKKAEIISNLFFEDDEKKKQYLSSGYQNNVYNHVLCPSCGKMSPKGKFCVVCGAALDKKCSKCGAEVPVSTKFCVVCGEKLEENS